MAPDPDEESSNPAFNTKEFLVRAVVGLVFVLIFAAPAWWALLHNSVTRLQTIVVYVAIALIAGIAFSVATVSQGRIQWGKLGISLGGGAAIGIAAIFIVHRLLPLPPRMALVKPAPAGNALFFGCTAGLQVRRVEGSQEFLVEVVRVEEGVEQTATFVVTTGDNTSAKKTYTITTDGVAIERPESQ